MTLDWERDWPEAIDPGDGRKTPMGDVHPSRSHATVSSHKQGTPVNAHERTL